MSNQIGRVVETTPSLIQRISSVLDVHQLAAAEQIVLFGSASVGMQSSRSDIDILLVGSSNEKRAMKIDGLDVSSIDLNDRHTSRWLGSELANHIARYGVWLRGQDDWSSRCFVSDESIAFKVRKIEARVQALDRAWNYFSAPYQTKHLRLVRRDLQRLELMMARRPVPPGPLLDSMWKNSFVPPTLDRLTTTTSEFIVGKVLLSH
jgi:predicted nucleotidyltransferase